MIDIAKRKCESLGSVRFVTGDARSMSIATAAADVVISSKLFLHVREWKKIVVEIKRITREGGYFIYINETGLFNNEVRKKFREQCIQGAMQIIFLGEVDLEKVGEWIEETGYRRVRIPEWKFCWEPKISYTDAYEALRNRAIVEFQKINDSDYQRNFDSTAEWIRNQPNGWDEIQEMKARLRVDIFRKTENLVYRHRGCRSVIPFRYNSGRYPGSARKDAAYR